MIVTVYYNGEYDDSFTFECETVKEAREIANREITKRGWKADYCWSEVEE